MAASHFHQFGSRQFCSALRFLIIFRLCLIQSTQLRSSCEMALTSPQAQQVKKHWISGTVKLTKWHSTWEITVILSPGLRPHPQQRGWGEAGRASNQLFVFGYKAAFRGETQESSALMTLQMPPCWALWDHRVSRDCWGPFARMLPGESNILLTQLHPTMLSCVRTVRSFSRPPHNHTF